MTKIKFFRRKKIILVNNFRIIQVKQFFICSTRSEFALCANNIRIQRDLYVINGVTKQGTKKVRFYHVSLLKKSKSSSIDTNEKAR